MSLIEYLFLFAGVMITGSLVLRMTISPKALKLLLAFSGAFLFSISVMELMPEIYSTGTRLSGIFILTGFLLQIIIEFFSKGIEHGHAHHDHEKSFPFTMMIALGVHSFLEGMPLAGHWQGDTRIHQSLLTGIILHNIPVSLALVLMLREARINTLRIFLWLAGFALMTPLGALSAGWAGSGLVETAANFFPYLMALVTGIFLHISTTILFESSENHRFNLIKFLVIILGAFGGILI